MFGLTFAAVFSCVDVWLTVAAVPDVVTMCAGAAGAVPAGAEQSG